MPKPDWQLNASTGCHILDVSANKRIVRINAQAPYIYSAEDWTEVDPGNPPVRYACTSMQAARKWLSNRSEIKWAAGTAFLPTMTAKPCKPTASEPFMKIDISR